MCERVDVKRQKLQINKNINAPFSLASAPPLRNMPTGKYQHTNTSTAITVWEGSSAMIVEERKIRQEYIFEGRSRASKRARLWTNLSIMSCVRLLKMIVRRKIANIWSCRLWILVGDIQNQKPMKKAYQWISVHGRIWRLEKKLAVSVLDIIFE